MSVYILIVLLNVGGTAVPTVKYRTLDAAECVALKTTIVKEHGPVAMCAVEHLQEGWSL